MRKLIKKIFLLFLFTTLAGCVEKSKTTGEFLDYIPENTSMIVKISDWKTFRNDIKNNTLIKGFKQTEISKLLQEHEVFLQSFQPDRESLLTFQEQNHKFAFTLFARQSDRNFQIDSTKNKVSETLEIDNIRLDRIEIENKTIFTSLIDSVFIASSSQEIAMNILKGKTEKSESFNRIKHLPSTDGLAVYYKGTSLRLTDSVPLNFTDWSALDILIAPESIIAQGISIAGDTIPQLLRAFEGQIPQQNRMAEIIPLNALSGFSFTNQDSERLQNNLNRFRGETSKESPTIFDSSGEIGVIGLPGSTAVFLRSIDTDITSDALSRYTSLAETYRDIEIKSFDQPELFRKTFSPLINENNAHFVFNLDDFFVFTPNIRTAQEMIGAYSNNSTLIHSNYFQDVADNLSASSSLLFYGMQGELQPILTYLGNSNLYMGVQETDFSEFPLFALQYSYDRDFAHIAISAKEFGSTAKTVSSGISEVFHLNLENEILSGPWIYEGNGSNFIVQDVNNTLYFISESGKILWSKPLNHAILGDISQIDIFKNGNQQIVFATENTVYILDRNGKDVAPFPLKFKDKITLPLSVFDYDGNKEYRFVVTQGKEVFMYDKNAKIVTGFGFKRAQSDIVQSPVHIRMGNKDYIVIAEKDGKLNILNRQGRTRVNVSKKFNFSNIPITQEDVKFVVITAENTKESISDKGEVSSIQLDVGSYWFSTLNTVKATLDDNLLRINGKLAELPIGIYSEPQLYRIGGSTYTTVTEIHEKKVYLFDEHSKLVSGFPVFGSSKASVGTRNPKNSYIVVKGETNGVIVYRFQ